MSKRVSFLDLASDYHEVADDVAARFSQVLGSQIFVLGAQTRELESSIAALGGVAEAIACSSGSEALVLALLALGIGRGDVVIVPAFSFLASAGAATRTGATVVFADVDADSFTMGRPELESVIEREFASRSDRTYVHRKSGCRLGAIFVVHLFGRAADMVGLDAVAVRLGVPMVGDAAQALGSTGDHGSVLSWGAAACLSFYPTKNLGGAGDAGMVTTNDSELARRVRRLRNHGAEPGEHVYHDCGVNARMDELQAAYLNAKLPALTAWTAARQAIAERYRARLATVDHLVVPAADVGHSYHQFVVRIITADRDRVAKRLADDGIETRVFYPMPLHLQPCFADLGYRPGDLPAAERLTTEVLALPIYPSLAAADVDFVCERLRDAVAS